MQCLWKHPSILTIESTFWISFHKLFLVPLCRWYLCILPTQVTCFINFSCLSMFHNNITGINMSIVDKLLVTKTGIHDNSAVWFFILTISMYVFFIFSCWGLNLEPWTCEASFPPLSYIPSPAFVFETILLLPRLVPHRWAHTILQPHSVYK